MHNGHEPEVREASRDRVAIRDQDVCLDDVRRTRGILMGRLTPFKSPCTMLAS